ncbi:MAG: ion transporter [Hyphomonas sp.]
MGIREWLYNELVPEARKTGISWTNIAIIGLVMLSFVFLALETEPTLLAIPAWKKTFDLFNIAVVVIFALEYAFRVWINGMNPKYKGVGGRFKYMCQFYSLADLLAFLPELIVMIVGGGVPLIALRVFRLFRLIKIARFVPAFEVLGAAMKRAGSQLLTTLSVALALVYIAAVALYFIEGVGQGREEFGSIPRAIWWSIATLTTVGYGDIYPVTVLGRVAASVIALAGIGVVALPAGVFASSFSDELRERELAKLKRRAEEMGVEPESDA